MKNNSTKMTPKGSTPPTKTVMVGLKYHCTGGISTGPSGDWPARSDPFSTHRAGYEIRSWRLCRRILVVHDFPELGGPRIVGAHILNHALSPAGAEFGEHSTQPQIVKQHGNSTA